MSQIELLNPESSRLARHQGIADVCARANALLRLAQEHSETLQEMVSANIALYAESMRNTLVTVPWPPLAVAYIRADTQYIFLLLRNNGIHASSQDTCAKSTT